MDYATTLNIDQQGRIIIPAKVRKALQLHTGDVLMLEADTRNICLRKCDSHIPMDIRLDSFLDILHSSVPCRILLCNHSKIIASKNYHTALNMPVTESIQRLLQQGKMKLFSDKERIYPTMTGKYPISAFFPISKKDEFGETLGLLLCTKNQQSFIKHGKLTIVLARFVPIIRSFAPLVAGAAKMSRLNFEVSGTVGAVLWAGIILAAGHLFGNIPFIKNNLSLILVGGIVLGLAPFVIGYIVKKWRQHPDEK